MISILSESKVAIEGIPIQIEKIMFFVVFKIQLMNACGNIVEERISNYTLDQVSKGWMVSGHVC